MIRLALMLFALLIGAPSWASAPPADTADADTAAAALELRFAEDAANHVRDLADLYSKRGISAPKMAQPKASDIVRYLVTSRDDASPGYPGGTAVLFYAHRGDRLAIYLIGQQGLLAYHVAAIAPAELRMAANFYRIDLNVDGIARSRAPVWTGPAPAAVTAAAAAPAVSASVANRNTPINDILLPPTIRTALIGVRHLVVVAGGVIATNPFAAFPLTGKDLLIDRMSVTVSAGLFDLDQMIRPWEGRNEFRGMLLVGDPLVPRTPEWKVPRLQGAADEALLLAGRVAATPLIGEAATKTVVVGRMGSAQMLYFAAHGASDPRAPLSGGFLMLAGPTPEQAFLTAGEVQQMDLRANLVVLSACQTGLGFNHDGGVIGLARAFQKAGAPRVVMSLWSVSDEATLYLMDHFQLAAMDNVPAEALRLAMLETRKKFPDPALWASFTLFGTPR
jgi:hypothetical protein